MDIYRSTLFHFYTCTSYAIKLNVPAIPKGLMILELALHMIIYIKIVVSKLSLSLLVSIVPSPLQTSQMV